MADQDEYKPIKTVGELKAAIANLPDDMPVGKWDGCESLMYSSINSAPSTVYLKFKSGDYESWSIYGGYDETDQEPTKQMLVI